MFCKHATHVGIVKFLQLCMKKKKKIQEMWVDNYGYSEAAITAAGNKDICRNPPTSNNKSTEPTACSAGCVSCGKRVPLRVDGCLVN